MFTQRPWSSKEESVNFSLRLCLREHELLVFIKLKGQACSACPFGLYQIVCLDYFCPTIITPACSPAYPVATKYLSHSLGSKTSLPLLSDRNAAIVVVPRLHS